MNSKQGRIDKVADRFMKMDSYDEREREVFTEATAFGLVLGIYANIAVALVAALLGALALPAGLLLLMGLPALATQWYAARHDVDLNELAARASLRRRTTTAIVIFAGLLLTIGAMAWTISTGQGLIPLPTVDLVGPGSSGLAASMAKGAVIGAAIGGAVAVVWIVVGQRRRTNRPDEAGADEEDFD